jgi:hypothetical protein
VCLSAIVSGVISFSCNLVEVEIELSGLGLVLFKALLKLSKQPGSMKSLLTTVVYRTHDHLFRVAPLEAGLRGGGRSHHCTAL